MKEKIALRESIRHRLQAFAMPARLAASRAICQAICQSAPWAQARLVCGFFPLPSEPDLRPLWSEPGGPDFCFPRVIGDQLELIRIADPAELAGATWKVADLTSASPVELAEVDLLLVPGLAFTQSGQRLGRGRGYYDRLLGLRGARTRVLGVCFGCQVVEALPIEPHDLAVERVITEGGAGF